jgi:hypothetical protein
LKILITGSLLASAEMYSPNNLVDNLDLLEPIEMIEKFFKTMHLSA